LTVLALIRRIPFGQGLIFAAESGLRNDRPMGEVPKLSCVGHAQFVCKTVCNAADPAAQSRRAAAG
jgi:hypothetical protein